MAQRPPARGRRSAAKRGSRRGPSARAAAPRDPLAATEAALLAALPKLAKAGVQRALAGKPASTLKAVRQMLREISAERAGDKSLRGCQAFTGLEALGPISPFEADMAVTMIKAFRGPDTTEPCFPPADLDRVAQRQAQLDARPPDTKPSKVSKK